MSVRDRAAINKGITFSRRGAKAQRRFFDRIYRIFRIDWI